MSLAAFAFLAVAFICVAGFFALRGKPSPAGSVVPLREMIPDEGEFGRLSQELVSLGFERIGDFKRETPTLSNDSVAVLRAFRSDERHSEALVYRTTASARQGTAAFTTTVLDFVSELDEEHSLTTTSSSRGIFLADPDRPSFKHPFARSASALWTLHAAHALKLWGGVECARPPRHDDFAARLTSVILRQMRYQAARGMYREAPGGIFYSTSHFALRGLLNHFLAVGDAASWRAPLFFLASLATGVAALMSWGAGMAGTGAVVAAGIAIGAGMPKGNLLWLTLYVAAIDTLPGGHHPAIFAFVLGGVGFWLGTVARAWTASRTANRDAAMT